MVGSFAFDNNSVPRSDHDRFFFHQVMWQGGVFLPEVLRRKTVSTRVLRPLHAARSEMQVGDRFPGVGPSGRLSMRLLPMGVGLVMEKGFCPDEVCALTFSSLVIFTGDDHDPGRLRGGCTSAVAG